MKRHFPTRLAFAVLVSVTCFFWNVSASHAQYQTRESEIVEKSTSVLNEFMTMPNQGIPTSMIQKAQGLVIVPGMLKLGFVVGGRRGKGIAVVRDENGAWHAPTFVTMTGGSVGFQAGVQSTDVILVFNTRNSVNNLMKGKFTIGVDAAAAAGPVGRQAAAATDSRLQAEIYSYSRSRGLFAGASIDGSVIQMDVAETQNFYRAAGISADGTPVAANAQLPLAAAQFLAALGTYSGAGVAASATTPPGTAPVLTGVGNTATARPANPAYGAGTPAGPVLPPGASSNSSRGAAPPSGNASATGAAANSDSITSLETTRQELARSAQSLGALLDESWRQYLSLPQGVFSGAATPTAESLRQSLQRFDAVTRDSRYNLLLQRKEFQDTYKLLKAYLQRVEAATPALTPPAVGSAPRTGAAGSVR